MKKWKNHSRQMTSKYNIYTADFPIFFHSASAWLTIEPCAHLKVGIILLMYENDEMITLFQAAYDHSSSMCCIIWEYSSRAKWNSLKTCWFIMKKSYLKHNQSSSFGLKIILNQKWRMNLPIIWRSQIQKNCRIEFLIPFCNQKRYFT